MNEVARRQGMYYRLLGLLLLAGLVVVVTLAALGFPSLRLLSDEAAFVAITGAILVLAGVQLAFLFTIRRTMVAVAEHEGRILEQSERHAELAEQMAEQFQRTQESRDRRQDDTIKALQERLDNESYALGNRPPRPTGPKPEPFGDVHNVAAIEGIGTHFAKSLAEIGIMNTRQLWNADATHVAGHLMIAPKTVENWQAMAELMAIKGIGAQYAELLLRAGVRTIEKLRMETPEHLSRKISRLEGRRDHRVQGNTIGEKVAASWITAASMHYRIEGPTIDA